MTHKGQFKTTMYTLPQDSCVGNILRICNNHCDGRFTITLHTGYAHLKLTLRIVSHPLNRQECVTQTNFITINMYMYIMNEC